LPDGGVCLAEVHATGTHCGCQIGIIINDQRDIVLATQRYQRSGFTVTFVVGCLFVPVLDDRRATGNCPGDAGC
jgi:hypothetical protein